MEKKISPENTTRQIVAGRRTTKKDVGIRSAIKFILQQQRAEGVTTADMSIVDGQEHDVDQLMRRIQGSLVQEGVITEAEVAGVADRLGGSKDALAVQIAQALNRYSMVDSADDRGMLLLIAALMLLNVSETDTTNGVVRRLITAGLSQMRKSKNDK